LILMTQDVWLARHPYLQPVAELHVLVDNAAVEIPIADPSALDWENYLHDFRRGIPLLHSSNAPIDFGPAERVVALLVEKLASTPLPGKLGDECRAVATELRGELDAPQRAVAWLLDRDVFSSACPGLLRYLGWTALARHLRPVVDAFASWRDEERWLRSYCPTCGSLPAMAQLVGTDPGHRRFLSCGRCGTRWCYRRTECPFCENENDHRLAVLAVEGEGGLRIDYCESCGGYLKTYDGEGSESVLLADWTSIHLDIVARDRGLKRLAASLYQF
jgi:FdhE protein